MRTTQPRILRRYESSLAAGWTLVIFALLGINVLHERAQTLETARTQARSNFQRDVTYRQWNAESGALYIEIGEQIQPNPFLSGLPERDVTTTTGKKLTLVNPAYMTRLVFDLAAKSREVRGHITSLRPVRPENLPDPWEAEALQAFVHGKKEASSVELMDGTSYLRLMGPLVTERECLRCHGKDGYRLGEIRGGISVAVPMEPLWKISRQNLMIYASSIILLWLTGLAGIFLGAARLRRTIRQRDSAELESAELNRNLLALTAEMEADNEALEAFCAAVSHDLRSPLTGIGGYSQLILASPAEGNQDVSRRFAGIILKETLRMEQLIDTLLNFSRVAREEPARETTDLSRVADELAGELRLGSPERRAKISIAGGMTAFADPVLLRVVMQNLLGNSWKYAGKREETEIECGVMKRGAETVYFVRDNGIGFDIASSGSMFEAFGRLANAGGFEGSGIGLATVRRILNRHGGRIWCESELDKGATFYFTVG